MLIGTDPEFILLDENGKVIRAKKIRYFNSTSPTKKVGCDGAGTQVEIRPAPASIKNIDRFYNNIVQTLKLVAGYCNKRKYTILGGTGKKGKDSMGETHFIPIGGHIHFGATNLDKLNKSHFIKILDTYFTPISNMLYSSAKIRKRRGNGYGRLGSYEPKNYGFEYRTPYTFLINPFYTKALFSLAGLIGNNYKKIKYEEDWYYGMKEWYNDGKQKHLDNIYPTLKKRILKLMSYNSPNQKQNPYIISLFNIIEQKKQCKSIDIIKNFSLENVPHIEGDRGLSILCENGLGYIKDVLRHAHMDTLSNDTPITLPDARQIIYIYNKVDGNDYPTMYISPQFNFDGRTQYYFTYASGCTWQGHKFKRGETGVITMKTVINKNVRHFRYTMGLNKAMLSILYNGNMPMDRFVALLECYKRRAENV